MDRDTAVGMVAQRLGNRDDLTVRIVGEMQLAQTDLEQGEGGFLPWFLIKSYDTIFNDAVQTDRILGATLTGFLLPVDDVDLEYLSANGTDWLRVSKVVNYSALQEATPGQFSYAPQIYSTLGNALVLKPDPKKVLQFRWSYYAADAPLTTNVTNLWLTYATELLIAYTTLKLAPALQMESAVVTNYAAMFTAALDRLRSYNDARKLEGGNLIMQYGNS